MDIVKEVTLNHSPTKKSIIYNSRPVKNSVPLIKAYEALMKTTIATMHEHDPQHAKHWTWGICEISDICYENPHFYYGSDGDKPKDFPAYQNVWVKIVDSKDHGFNRLALIS